MKLKELINEDRTFAHVFQSYNPDSKVVDLSINDYQLTSLVGCPRIVLGEFNCANNKLTYLEHGPLQVNDNYFCSNNKLTSLEGAPKIVGGDFNCAMNKLTNLKGAPDLVDGGFFCANNLLTSLEGAPKKISGIFSFSDNAVTSLEGCPSELVGGVFGYGNKLTSLKDIHKQIKKIKSTKSINNGGSVLDFTNNSITSHILGVMLIPNLSLIVIDNKHVQAIVNRHLKNKSDVFECQLELMDEGFDEYAQL